MFETHIYGNTEELIDICYGFLENKYRDRLTDGKRQNFYTLVLSKYQFFYPDLANKFIHKIKKYNIFNMKTIAYNQILINDSIHLLNFHKTI